MFTPIIINVSVVCNFRSYFAPEGIGYNLCRIPIAGSDFSIRPYSYDDVEGDVDLEFFALTDEDINWKVGILISDIIRTNFHYPTGDDR